MIFFIKTPKWAYFENMGLLREKKSDYFWDKSKSLKILSYHHLLEYTNSDKTFSNWFRTDFRIYF